MKRNMFENLHLRVILPEIVLMLASVISFLLALCLPLLALGSELTEDEQRLMNAYETGDVIRLHILANSDSPEDQQIKLQVRDAVLLRFGGILKNAGTVSPEEVCAFLALHLDEIDSCAKEAARKAGHTGSVKTEYGLLHLPEKSYGQVILPEGDYLGLRITLGVGQGQNWWCVLYPELCSELLCQEASPPKKPDFYFDSLRIFQNWLLVFPL